MANCVWTYVSTNSKQFRVELYHGETTGHVLMTVNGKVTVIDFKVFQSKSYSLFLDHELCSVVLDRTGDEMRYRFETDLRADTPLNRARRERDRKDWIRTLLFFGIGLLLIFGIAKTILYLRENPSQVRAEQLLNGPDRREGVAKLVVNNDGISYSFLTQRGNVQHGELPLSSSQGRALPLRTGDEYRVIYAQGNAHVNRLKLNEPILEPNTELFQSLLDRVAQLEATADPVTVVCFVETAIELRGTEGVANLLFAQSERSANPRHNKITYQRMVRDPQFRAAVAACWQRESGN